MDWIIYLSSDTLMYLWIMIYTQHAHQLPCTVIVFFSQEQTEKTRKIKLKNHIHTCTSLDDHNLNGETPLTCAARAGHVKICELLLDEGAFINQTTQYVNQTPLHVAIEHGNTDVVEYLINQGADAQIADNVNISPLYTAIKGGNSYLVHLLIDAGCDVNLGSQDHAPIFLAARLGLLAITQVNILLVLSGT